TEQESNSGSQTGSDEPTNTSETNSSESVVSGSTGTPVVASANTQMSEPAWQLEVLLPTVVASANTQMSEPVTLTYTSNDSNQPIKQIVGEYNPQNNSITWSVDVS
ncbi:hypothetical protein, partial [Ligilactobacillus agilis]|uniref:hypothetical protein n=1 Tax=Ligilactobacillus agilis TaxID=1601 RepID=UPI001558CC7A